LTVSNILKILVDFSITALWLLFITLRRHSRCTGQGKQWRLWLCVCVFVCTL